MGHAASGLVDTVAHLLQDQRVHATVDVQGRDGETALHHACTGFVAEAAAIKVHFLLQASADSLVTDKYGLKPLTWTREVRPFQHTIFALLEEASDANKASLLVKARRLAVGATSRPVAPSCPQNASRTVSSCRAWRWHR